jgi:hypothetical protein
MARYALKKEIVQGLGSRADLPANKLPSHLWLEKLPVGAYTCDLEGLINYFNPSAIQLWGRVPQLNNPLDRY